MTGASGRPAAAPDGRRSPAHGFGDDEATRRLLRSRPPRQALAWATARLGSPVLSARALRGGMSSAVHLLTTQGAGPHRHAVLRRYVRPESIGEEPDLPEREAQALGVAEAAGVPTPALLAIDPDGAAAGVPAVLMSRLPGRVDWWPSDLDRWLRLLAGILPRIHAVPLPPPGGIRFLPPGQVRAPTVHSLKTRRAANGDADHDRRRAI